MTYEYRVRWRRNGQSRSTTRILQRWDSAVKKARTIRALEAVRDETRFRTMEDLVEGPVIEQRKVGEWIPAPGVVLGEPSDMDRASILEWAGPKEIVIPDGEIPF
jgi:hypothetical protein